MPLLYLLSYTFVILWLCLCYTVLTPLLYLSYTLLTPTYNYVVTRIRVMVWSNVTVRVEVCVTIPTIALYHFFLLGPSIKEARKILPNFDPLPPDVWRPHP